MVKNDIEMIAEINQLISKRTNYGIREEKVTKNSKCISWSNASKNWIYWGFPSNKTQFDANQVLIPNIPEKQLKAIINKLDVLPLYKYSTEARFAR